MSPGDGPVVLVSRVGEAGGARSAAAAIACAGSAADRASLLVDLDADRPPRPALVATVPARGLEERLAAHLPQSPVAARGHFCQLAIDREEAAEQLPAALAIARGAAAVVHLPPSLLRGVLDEAVCPTAVVLRADLTRDRSLAALAVRDLLARGIAAVVLKRPLGWVAARRALFGVLPPHAPDGLPPRLRERCLG